MDNELCCLRHGVFNLGFLAVKTTGQGREFIDWWADRLRRFCYDEIPNGLFTDQRRVDLAPAYFDDIAIVREPEFNVATWNLTHRRATGRAPYEIGINGEPLVFYHFSGFDSGTQQVMLDRYGRTAPCSSTCESGTSRGARSSASRPWAKPRVSTTRSTTGNWHHGPDGWFTGSRRRPGQHFPDPYETNDPRLV